MDEDDLAIVPAERSQLPCKPEPLEDLQMMAVDSEACSTHEILSCCCHRQPAHAQRATQRHITSHF